MEKAVVFSSEHEEECISREYFSKFPQESSIIINGQISEKFFDWYQGKGYDNIELYKLLRYRVPKLAMFDISEITTCADTSISANGHFVTQPTVMVADKFVKETSGNFTIELLKRSLVLCNGYFNCIEGFFSKLTDFKLCVYGEKDDESVREDIEKFEILRKQAGDPSIISEDNLLQNDKRFYTLFKTTRIEVPKKLIKH